MGKSPLISIGLALGACLSVGCAGTANQSSSQAAAGSGGSNAALGTGGTAGTHHSNVAGSGGLGGSSSASASGSSGGPGSAGGAVDCAATIADGGIDWPAYDSFASGRFSGGLSGEICTNGAIAYLERTSGSLSVPSQLVLLINNLTLNAESKIELNQPSNATGGELSVFIGALSSASPGTYTSAETCGSIALSALLPTTANCNQAPSTGPGCPPGCALGGPVLGPSCMPIVPEISYAANAASDCVLETMSPLGSWSLTLSSVTLLDPPDGSFGTGYYLAHGTLSATLVSDDADAGAATTALQLSF